jgi:GT2 family glycosyltransferase
MVKTSIIILNWNTLSYLKKCVESIKNYTKDYELIMIDNNSSEDGTKSYIIKEADKCLFNLTNLGFSKGNNQGAKMATGEYLCFMNSDIVVGKGWLRELHKTLRMNEGGAVGPLGNPRFGEINGVQIAYNQYKGQYKEDVCVDSLVGFCILMKKNLFEEIDGWDEDFTIGNYEDNMLCEKIKNKGYRLYISYKSNVSHDKPSQTFIANNIDYLGSLNNNRDFFVNKMKQLKLLKSIKGDK